MHQLARKLSRLTFLFILPALLSACAAPPDSGRVRSSVVEAMSGGQDQPFARATEPMDFVFPRDHGPHEEFRTEWWYYTGNLEDAAGNPYGYQLTFFRNALTPESIQRISDRAANDVYMAHFALTDGRGNEHYSFDRYSRGDGELAGAIGEPTYHVWLEDWEAIETEPGIMRLRASASPEDRGDGGEIAIELMLEQTAPPILHGDRGLSQKGDEAGNANYYYSLTRLVTTGTITLDETQRQVTGLSWMDHEFGTSALDEKTRGWDWFSVQLDNGVSIMFAELHDGFGGNRFVMESTLVYPDGRQLTLGDEDFDLRPLSQWTSPRTGITYPSAWEVSFPREELTLTLTPLIADQEMDTDFVYYEGAIDAAGSMAGVPVTGRGYVELTGYGEGDLAEYQR